MNRVPQHKYSPDSAEMHKIIEYIYKGRAYFFSKNYLKNELIMHLPLPLSGVLYAVCGKNNRQTEPFNTNIFTLFGINCVPAYENRIVITCPKLAIFDNEPMVVIELDANNSPTYFELNEYD